MIDSPEIIVGEGSVMFHVKHRILVKIRGEKQKLCKKYAVFKNNTNISKKNMLQYSI